MSATLTQLQNRALDYADMTGSAFPVTDRVTDYINAGLSELHDLLVQADADYFLSTQAYAIVAGTETYALPSNFYRARKVFYTSAGRRYKVERFNLDEIDAFQTSPLVSGSVTMWYIPELTLLSAGGDTVEAALPEGWEDFVALHAAIRLMMREESDTSAYERERERLRQRFVALAAPRDIGESDVVSDHYNRFSMQAHTLQAEERKFKYRILGQNIHFIEAAFTGAV